MSDPRAKLGVMNTEQLWELIEQARAAEPARGFGEAEAVVERAVALLAERAAGEIADAHRELWGLLAASYRDSLWAAAYLLNGGCSDDGFDYFRGWLVTQGREVFEAAIADPDSLAAVPAVQAAAADGMELECEDALGLARRAYRSATGGDPEQPLPSVPYPEPDVPGWEFDFDDGEEMARKLPRLSALVSGD